MRLPAHAGLERRRKDLILEKLVNEDDRRPRDEYHERHPHKQSGMIGKETRRGCGAFHEVDQLGNERGKQHLANGGQQIEKEDQRKRWPYRCDEVPIKRQQRARRHDNAFTREGIDSAFKPSKHEPLGLSRTPAQTPARPSRASTRSSNVNKSYKSSSQQMFAFVAEHCSLVQAPHAASPAPTRGMGFHT